MACYSKKLTKGVKWCYKFYFNKTRYSSPCKYNSKSEAQRAEREHIKGLESIKAANQDSVKLTLKRLIDERLKYLKARKSKNYTRNSERYFNIILQFFGDIEVINIRKLHLVKFFDNYANEDKTKGLTNNNVNSMLRAVKALFNYGIDLFEIEMLNPCKGIKLYSIEKKIKYIPSDEDINKVLALCNDRQRLLVEFVMQTGARIGEALRFTKEDIFEDYIVLYTRKSAHSNKIPRKIPIPDCLKNEVIEGRLIFPEWIEQPRFLEDKVTLLKQKRWSWHCLRHRYASLLSKQNKPIFEIMTLLGHTNIQTTQIYLQLLP